jgi:hypothetical protein
VALLLLIFILCRLCVIDLCWKFSHTIVLQEYFNTSKIEKFYNAKKIIEENGIFAFFKNWHYRIFIFCTFCMQKIKSIHLYAKGCSLSKRCNWSNFLERIFLPNQSLFLFHATKYSFCSPSGIINKVITKGAKVPAVNKFTHTSSLYHLIRRNVFPRVRKLLIVSPFSLACMHCKASFLISSSYRKTQR